MVLLLRTPTRDRDSRDELGLNAEEITRHLSLGLLSGTCATAIQIHTRRLRQIICVSSDGLSKSVVLRRFLVGAINFGGCRSVSCRFITPDTTLSPAIRIVCIEYSAMNGTYISGQSGKDLNERNMTC